MIKRFALLGNHLPRHCGTYTLDADGDGINLYDDAADTSIALATGKVSEILDWLGRHGTGI